MDLKLYVLEKDRQFWLTLDMTSMAGNDNDFYPIHGPFTNRREANGFKKKVTDITITKDWAICAESEGMPLFCSYDVEFQTDDEDAPHVHRMIHRVMGWTNELHVMSTELITIISSVEEDVAFISGITPAEFDDAHDASQYLGLLDSCIEEWKGTLWGID